MTAPGSARRAHVLVVEDNALNLKLVQEILRINGYTSVGTSSAEEAIRQAAEQEFDVILMDIQLPGMDGLEATRRLKQDSPARDVPIVAVSALAHDDDRERALGAGCVAYVEKPYGVRALLKVLNAVAPAAGSGLMAPTPATMAGPRPPSWPT